MTCVCFAEPSSLGVTEPFLTQNGLSTKGLPFFDFQICMVASTNLENRKTVDL
jgi:hypothetical protein